MLEKIISVDEKDYPSWYDKKVLGGYNDLPFGWRKISSRKFLYQFLTYTASHQEFRQVPIKPGEAHSSIHLYYYHGPEGVAIVPSIKDCSIAGIKAYAFGCEHEFELVNREILAQKYPEHVNKYTPGRCCHNSVCTKCRKFKFIDSSD